MNVAFLLKQYFDNQKDVSIDVFDAHTLNNVYQNVLKTLTSHFDSGNEVLRVLIADDGVGIRESLAENERFRNVEEGDALQLCLLDSVTDGKGMGFGLYATSRLMKDAGLQFIIHSGGHLLGRRKSVA